MDKAAPRRSNVEQYLDPGYLDLEGLLDALEREIASTGSLFGKQGLALRDCPPERRKLAISISGGGASGAYCAGLLDGLLAGLRKRGIKIGLLVGTSSGALNGYGVFLEEIGKANPQFQSDPSVRQPFGTYIASVWSYLDRDGEASRWIVGRRSWIVGLISRGVRSPRFLAGISLLAVAVAVLLQPNLLLPLALVLARAGFEPAGWIESAGLAESVPFLFGCALAATLVLAGAVWLVRRAFRHGLFLDVPLLKFLANTGPDGDLRNRPQLSRAQAVDRARNLSRDIVSEWYRRMDELPEFVVTGTDISASHECLFTLVQPDTYRKILRRGWMAAQFDSPCAPVTGYNSQPRALFTLPENLLRSVVASSAVPGAFPTQCIEIYGPGPSRVARHHFVDGGVLNNSPIHVAIDAGATHVISLEIRPFETGDPLDVEVGERDGYEILEAAVATFTTVLERATDGDVRRTAAWNRFLLSRRDGVSTARGKDAGRGRDRRVVPIYRIAPRSRLLGTVEFDGRFEGGRRTVTLRDLLRRGVLDMRGRNIWAATVRHEPEWNDPDRELESVPAQASS